MVKSFRIRNSRSTRRLFFRPAGVTDISFRRLVKSRGGVGLTVSEFIRSKADAQQSQIETTDAFL